MNKKAIMIKISAICVQVVPVITALCLYAPVFVKRTESTISAAAILVAIICALIFKDATKKFFSAPSGFKTCLIAFLLSLIAVNLGQQILVISSTALVSGVVATPLNLWYNNETGTASNDKILKSIQGMMNNGTDK